MDLTNDLKKYSNTLIPAVGDGETFTQLNETNASAIFLSGKLTARNLIAEKSEGLLSVTEYAQFAHHMRIKKKKPMILDLQSGFGNPLNTFYAAKKLENSGGDVLLLNDQTYPSYSIEKPEITTDEDIVGKIRASLDSFDNPGTQLWVKLEGLHDYGIEGFKKRAQYAANAGARAIVVSHYSLEELQSICSTELELPIIATATNWMQETNNKVIAWLDEGHFLQKANETKRQFIDEWFGKGVNV